MIAKLWGLIQLIYVRLRIIFIEKRELPEIARSAGIIKEYTYQNFWARSSDRFWLLILLALFVLAYLLFDNLSFQKIDRALHNQKSAKALNLLRARSVFTPESSSVQLRKAHAYLGLGNIAEAYKLTAEVAKEDINHQYLPLITEKLAKELRRRDQGEQIVWLLEKLADKCHACEEELRKIYTKTGRRLLANNELQKARRFLARALHFAKRNREANSTISYREKELSRLMVLEVQQEMRSEDPNLRYSIELLENSLQLSAKGESYQLLGDLYLRAYTDTEELEDLKKSLQAYTHARSFALQDAESKAEQSKKKLRIALKKQGRSDEAIEKEIEAIEAI